MVAKRFLKARVKVSWLVEAGVEGDVEDGGVEHQESEGGALQAQAQGVLLQRLADGGVEAAVEMVGREPGQRGEAVQGEIPVEVRLDAHQDGEQTGQLLRRRQGREGPAAAGR